MVYTIYPLTKKLRINLIIIIIIIINIRAHCNIVTDIVTAVMMWISPVNTRLQDHIVTL